MENSKFMEEDMSWGITNLRKIQEKCGKGKVREFLEEQKEKLKDSEESKDKELWAMYDKLENMLEGHLVKDTKIIVEAPTYDYGSINFVEDITLSSWDRLKGIMKKELGQGKEYDSKVFPKWFFLSHSNDVIIGKPQLIDNVQKRIPLIRQSVRKEKVEFEDGSFRETEIQRFHMFDEKYDKRYDGFQRDCFALDFWIYKVINNEGKEYYLLSNNQLPNETCEFRGMNIEIDDIAEMSRSMKLKSLSRIFILNNFEASVKIITKEELIKLTKGVDMKEEDWFRFLGYHKFHTINRFPKEMELLKSAFVLSGKVDSYPLHLAILGPSGTRKTMGHIETLGLKFSEDPMIVEGADSRIKGLSPSFKEKPANPGYLAKAERMGFIDEIGKMIEAELNKHQANVNNVLGELNFLLEHKKRTVGSGNDNELQVQANAKFLFVSNPVSGKKNIYQHVGLIDPTTMSRILWWVQNQEEQNFVFSNDAIEEISPNTYSNIKLNEEEETKIYLTKCWGKGIGYRASFLKIYDTCLNFLCPVDKLKVQALVKKTTNWALEPMKSSVWKPRAAHHIALLVDGLCKHRCLFRDYNSNFKPIDEDYQLAEKILRRMITSWETNLSPREEIIN